MTVTKARLCIAALATAGTLLLVSCSSDEAPTDGTSTSASPASSAAASGDPAAAGSAAAAACAAYFELDLLNSSYAGGAVADGDMTETQVREDFARLLKKLRRQAAIAVDQGSADEKLLVNATKMKRAVDSLGEDDALVDLTRKQQTAFAKQSLRVQRACNRTGFPLPDDNITARTAAGI